MKGTMLTVTLQKNATERLRGGHPWIFSNEVQEMVGERLPGAAAEVYAANGSYLGSGHYNPRSLIAVRLLTRKREDIESADFLRGRLANAIELRRRLYPLSTTMRLVHGEGDFLPGLVVDRYGDYLALQLLTAGMDRRRQLLVELLQELLAPRGIIARNDVAVRALEGLEQEVTVLAGEVPERTCIQEHGLKLAVDLHTGQKTGHFLDQKENHLLLAPLSGGATVLDCFSYAGSWGLHAAAGGAREVTCLDISPRAVALIEENARLNGVSDRLTAEEVDVFERLRSLKEEGRRFDVVVLDPPAFVKSKKQLADAIKGYLTINRRALELLAPGGHLVTCSCSYHVSREVFREMLAQAASLARRPVRFVATGRQSPDHPALLAVPESEYLKCCVLQAL